MDLKKFEKKFKPIYKSRAQVRESRRKKRQKFQKLKKEKARLAALEKMKLQDPKKDPIEEIYESFLNEFDTDFIQQIWNKNKKRQRKSHISQRNQVLELEKNLDEVQQDENFKFLTNLEIIQIRQHMSDYNIGDYMLVFQNPDDENLKNKPVSLSQALKIYDGAIIVQSDEGFGKQELDREREAFIKAFLSMPEYESDENRVKREKREEEMKEFMSQTQSPSLNEQRVSTRKSEHNNEEEKLLDNQFKENLDQNQQEQFGNQLQIIKKNKSEEKSIDPEEIDKKEQLLKTENPLEQLKLKGKILQEQLMKEKIINRHREDPAFNLNISDLRPFLKMEKNYCHGGFLYKKVMQDTDDYDWICTDDRPKDFLTLLRFVIMTKLSRYPKLFIRTVVSQSGKEIFVVLKAKNEMIQIEGELRGMNKQLELGLSDLFSLEPVDLLFRPLRIKEYVRSIDVKILDQKIKQEKLKIQDPDNQSQDGPPRGQRIDSKAHSIYQKVRKMSEEEFLEKINILQRKVDLIYKGLADELRYDFSIEKVEIQDDQPITREVWEVYYIYLEYIVDYMGRVENFKQKIKEDKKKQKHDIDYKSQFKILTQNKYFIYKLIFLKAIGDSNEVYRDFHKSCCKKFLGLDYEINHKLKNIWDLLGYENPIPPYADFFCGTEEKRQIWRRHEINEKGQRRIFMNMERLILCDSLILKNVNVLQLIREKLCLAYIPLHDYYQLKGILKEPMLRPLYDSKMILQENETQGERIMKILFMALCDEAENVDFDTDGSSLIDDCAFQWRRPSYIDINSLRNYFGEKIAIYFQFLSTYNGNIFFMAILGIGFEIGIGLTKTKQLSGTKADVNHTLRIIYSIILILWQTLFLENWKRTQFSFALQYGQIGFEEDEAVRPAYQGKFIRSVINDRMNSEYYPQWLRMIKMLFSYLISFLIICCVIASVFGIFFLKRYLHEQTNNSFVNNTIPSIINSAQIFLFNAIYQTVALITNDKENHKYFTSNENSLVFKIFSFTFINTFNSFIIIAFLNSLFSDLKICKVGSNANDIDCFQALEVQMRTIFIVYFIKNIPELVLPMLKIIAKNQIKEIDLNPIIHQFTSVDQFYEEQYNLNPYEKNEEIDGTVDDYMELIIQFGFLSMFSLAFPSAFTISYITNIFEIIVDKHKLTDFSRRPVPARAANIGTWYYILELISFISMFVNAGLIAFTSKSISNENQIIVFVILLLVFLSVKYTAKTLIPDQNEQTLTLMKRHKFIVERVVKGFELNKQVKMATRDPDFRIQGLRHRINSPDIIASPLIEVIQSPQQVKKDKF